MSKLLIKLGALNKKLLFPFFLALAQIILLIFELYYPERQNISFIDLYSEALGQIAIIIIPYLRCFSISHKKDKFKCQCSKKNFLHYFILLSLYYIDLNTSLFCSFYAENVDEMNSLISTISDYFSTKVGIEIILITILDKLLLKYEYFIHHYISIFIFLLFSVSIDLLLDNYYKLSDKSFLELFLNILNILSHVAYLCYIKYMIDRHYHYYWNIVLSLGIAQTIINSRSVLNLKFNIILSDSFKNIGANLFEYFNGDKGIIIGDFIINFILQFIFHALQILTIFYLSPEYILISQNVARIIIFIIPRESIIFQ